MNNKSIEAYILNSHYMVNKDEVVKMNKNK